MLLLFYSNFLPQFIKLFLTFGIHFNLLVMTNTEVFEINLSLMMIGLKTDSLIKALTPEQREIYKNSIEEYKKVFLDGVAKHLPKDRVSELLLLLE